MNLKQLSYIIALEEEGNISSAAQKLNVSQSTLSKHLAGLEASLDAVLFVRMNKQLTPTRQGRIYLEAARQILQLYRFAGHTIANMTGAQTTDLSIGFTSYNDTQFLFEFMRDFQNTFPNITLHAQEGMQSLNMSQVQAGNLSLAIVDVTRKDEESFQYIPILESELLLAIPKAHGIALLGDTISDTVLNDLTLIKNCKFVLPSSRTTTRELVDSLFATTQITPNIAGEIDHPGLRLAMVKQNNCCTFLVAKNQQKDPEIIYLHLKGKYQIQECVLLQKDKEPTTIELWCIEKIQQFYR